MTASEDEKRCYVDASGAKRISMTGDWYDVCARQPGWLARCPVTVSVYQSAPGDDGLLPHTDAWHGLVVHLAGTKRWSVFSDAGAHEHDVSAGDVVYVPTRVRHSVVTLVPSVHAVIELITPDARGPLGGTPSPP